MLNIVLGPMCAGKTSKLIQDYNSLTGSKVILDFEIGDKTMVYASHVTTHDGIKQPCYKCKKLFDTLDIYKHWGNFQISHEYFYEYSYKNAPEMYTIHDAILKSESIFINEAQFFTFMFPSP